ncbi:MAG: glycosyltransferase family protein [Candidatus Fonsibacter ubiquis]
MKILCKQENGKQYRKLSAIGKIFSDIGDEFVFWDNNQKSAFDAFYEREPDLFISCTSSINKSIIKCLKKYNNIKVILLGSYTLDGISNKNFCTEEEYTSIKELMEQTGKPDILLQNCTEKTLSLCSSKWLDLGINTLDFASACDIYLCFNPIIQEKFISDLSYVGNYTNYKSKEFESVFFNLLKNKELSIKIFGKNKCQLFNYLGFVDNKEIKDVIASAKICPTIYQKHNYEYGFGIPQFLFDVFSCNGITVMQKNTDTDFIFNDIGIYADNQENYLNKVLEVLKNIDQYKDSCNAIKKHIYNNHTYHHRLIRVLKNINFENYENKINENLLSKGVL